MGPEHNNQQGQQDQKKGESNSYIAALIAQALLPDLSQAFFGAAVSAAVNGLDMLDFPAGRAIADEFLAGAA